MWLLWCGQVRKGWTNKGDYDAIECFVVVFLPIIPFRAMHTCNWNGEQFQMIPIHMTWGLLLRAMLRPYVLGLLGGTIIGVAASVIMLWVGEPWDDTAPILWLSLAVLAIAGAVQWMLEQVNRAGATSDCCLARTSSVPAIPPCGRKTRLMP